MSETYNGWTNYETWNVALWIGNDEGLYIIACECKDYNAFVVVMSEHGIDETPDEVSYTDDELNIDELNNMMDEL